MRNKKTLAVTAAALSGALLAAGGSSGGSGGASGGTDWSKVASVAQGGGMKALIAAAKKEGGLNVITLPANWANYGTIMKDFTAKYGIKINDANPDGSSQDEINAMVQLKGQSRAPDVLDTGTAFAIKADQEKLLAKYEVAAWNDIPAAEKSTDGDLVRRLRRLRGDRSRRQEGDGPADVAQGPRQAHLQARGGDQRQPGRGERGFSAVYAATLPTAARSATSSRAWPSSRS